MSDSEGEKNKEVVRRVCCFMTELLLKNPLLNELQCTAYVYMHLLLQRCCSTIISKMGIFYTQHSRRVDALALQFDIITGEILHRQRSDSSRPVGLPALLIICDRFMIRGGIELGTYIPDKHISASLLLLTLPHVHSTV